MPARNYAPATRVSTDRVCAEHGRDERQCNTCEQFRSLTAFSDSNPRQCRPCANARERELRRNREARRAAGQVRRNPAGRIFGIEMELTGPDASTVITALRQAGIRMAPINLRTLSAAPYQHTNTEDHVWTLKRDGSVSGFGLELVSPKLRGEAGLEEVRTVCTALNGVNASVNRSTGLHVHHDMRNLGIDSLKKQALAFLERQDLIMGMVAPSRRANGYCTVWGERHVEALRATRSLSDLSYGIGPRGNLNLGAYAAHGSFEIRCHAGTTNAKKIVAWIRFGQAIFAAGEAEANVSTTDRTQLLSDLAPFGLTTEDASWLLRFDTVGESRAAVAARLAQLRTETEILESVGEEDL